MKILTPRLILLLTVSFIMSCGSKEGMVSLSGKITNAIADQPVTLSKFEAGGFQPADTINIAEDGVYSTEVEVQSATFFRINFHNRRQVDFILDGSESGVTIDIDATDLQADPKISGSPETKHIEYYNKLMSGMREDEQMLTQQAMQARSSGNEAEMQGLTDEYNTLVSNYFENVKNYSHKIKPSIAVFYGIGSLRLEDHYEFYEEMADFYEEKLPDHVLTEDLVTRVGALKNLAVGSEAPEISLPSPDGEVISLSSLRGNYVLIDFWAAWCRPCRMENPNVVRLYNQYKDQNFEILGVSLDRSKDAWVKAIQQDGLIWKHVSDLKYFQSEAAAKYQISAIPATYLIGPDGKIIAKGLRGPSLEAKLKEIFG